MRILITGGKGQLGEALAKVFSQEAIVCGKEELDVTNRKKIERVLKYYQPQGVIQGAALTDVEGCEVNPQRAYQVNAIGTANIAQVCREINAFTAYVSTDFVFDGKKGEPYNEFDTVNPLNHYGRSKLLGEKMLQSLNPKHYILRTAWLYGGQGRNFVESIIEKAKTGKIIKVVSDEIGSPTYVKNLARAIKDVLDYGGYGTYHLTNRGMVSRFAWAEYILSHFEKSHLLRPIKQEDIIWPVRRPKNSAMEGMRLAMEGIKPLNSWQEGMTQYFIDRNMGNERN